MRNQFFFCIIFGFFLIESLQAQITGTTEYADARQVTDQSKTTRVEDNFLRKRVRYRIDLLDKINKPMDQQTSMNLYDESSRITSSNKEHFDYSSDMVSALISGYANRLMEGYNPEKLDKKLDFFEFKANYKKLDVVLDSDENSNENSDENEAVDDCYCPEEEKERQKSTENIIATYTEDFSSMVKAVDVIEDRIFDKNKSTVVYKPRYIVIYKKNASEIEVPLVAFKYEDIADGVLSKYQWTNRFNDAEHRNLKEIFELRLFNSYITGLSNDRIQTIDVSEKRRVQLMESEYNQFGL